MTQAAAARWRRWRRGGGGVDTQRGRRQRDLGRGGVEAAPRGGVGIEGGVGSGRPVHTHAHARSVWEHGAGRYVRQGGTWGRGSQLLASTGPEPSMGRLDDPVEWTGPATGRRLARVPCAFEPTRTRRQIIEVQPTVRSGTRAVLAALLLTLAPQLLVPRGPGCPGSTVPRSAVAHSTVARSALARSALARFSVSRSLVACSLLWLAPLWLAPLWLTPLWLAPLWFAPSWLAPLRLCIALLDTIRLHQLTNSWNRAQRRK